jgi:hypothetical protein
MIIEKELYGNLLYDRVKMRNILMELGYSYDENIKEMKIKIEVIEK